MANLIAVALKKTPNARCAAPHLKQKNTETLNFEAGLNFASTANIFLSFQENCLSGEYNISCLPDVFLCYFAKYR